MRLSTPPIWQYLLLSVLFIQVIFGQGLSWVQYPSEVVTGESYPIEWEPKGVPATVQILKGGNYQTTIFYSESGDTTNFSWNVDNSLEAGTDYMLQIVPVQGGELLSSGTIWVIAANGGLVVNGQTITASVADGPSVATSTTAQSGSSGVYVVTSSGSSGSEATDAVRTLTYVSGTNTYTQTITLSGSTATDSAGHDYQIPRGLTGGEIAGIVVGVVVGIALIVLFAWFLRRKQRQRTALAEALAGATKGEKDDASISGTTANDLEGNRNTMFSDTSETAGGSVDKKRYSYQPYRVPRSEMDGESSRYEMPGAPAPAYELPAEDVPRRGPLIPSTCVPLHPDGPSNTNAMTPLSTEIKPDIDTTESENIEVKPDLDMKDSERAETKSKSDTAEAKSDVDKIEADASQDKSTSEDLEKTEVVDETVQEEDKGEEKKLDAETETISNPRLSKSIESDT